VWLVALAIAGGFAPGVARAQVSQIVFPPSLMVPNHNRVFPGLTESIESGADLVRAWTAPAVYYNPAGLVLSTRTALNASLQGYQATFLSGTGFNEQGVQISNLRGVPSFVGIVFGEEAIPLRTVRFGFAVSNPISWEQGLNLSSATPAMANALYNVNSTFVQYQAAAAVSWAVSDRFRLGFSLAIPYTHASNEGQLTGSLRTPATGVGSIRTVSFSGYNFHVLATASFQWEALDWLALGAVVAPPALRLLRGGSLTLQGLGTGTTSSSTTTEQLTYRDTGATFNYVIPAEFSAGVAFRFGPVEVEVDAHWYLGTGPYNLLSSTVPVYVLATAAGSDPRTTASSLPTQVWGTRGVVDLNLGGHYKISQLVTVHGGFYSSHAPGNVPSNFFQDISLYGIRGGLSFTTTSISGSVGLGYEFGSASTPLFDVTPPGVPPQTLSKQTLSIGTLSLLFALAYVF
jgi:hypothetical protein